MEGKTGLLYFFFAVRWLLSLDSYSNMASICHLHTPEEYTSLLSLYNMWLFDCDGVLQVWNGDELIDGAVQVLKMLRQQSKSTFVFILSDSDFFFVVPARQEGSVRLQFDKIKAGTSEEIYQAWSASSFSTFIISNHSNNNSEVANIVTI